jgi:hypothetical protein
MNITMHQFFQLMQLPLQALYTPKDAPLYDSCHINNTKGVASHAGMAPVAALGNQPAAAGVPAYHANN